MSPVIRRSLMALVMCMLVQIAPAADKSGRWLVYPCVASVSVSRDGNLLALRTQQFEQTSDSLVYSVWIIDASRGERLWQSLHTEGWLWHVAGWIGDGTTLLVYREAGEWCPKGSRFEIHGLEFTQDPLSLWDSYALVRTPDQEWLLHPVPELCQVRRSCRGSDLVTAMSGQKALYTRGQWPGVEEVYEYDIATSSSKPLLELHPPGSDYSLCEGTGGRYLMAWEYVAPGDAGNFRLFDIETRRWTPVDGPSQYRARPVISPDGRWAVWEQYHGEQIRLLIRPVARSGSSPETFEIPGIPVQTLWSGDMKYLVCRLASDDPGSLRGILYLIDREEKDVKELEAPGDWVIRPITWMPGTTAVLCGAGAALWSVNVESGEWRKVWSFPEEIKREYATYEE